MKTEIKYLLLVDKKGAIKTNSISKELCEEVINLDIGKKWSSKDMNYTELRVNPEELKETIDPKERGIETLLEGATDLLFVKDGTDGKAVNPYAGEQDVREFLPEYSRGRYDSHGNLKSSGSSGGCGPRH